MRRRPSRSRVGALRKWWHGYRGHHVLGTTVRDYRQHGPKHYEFFFRPGWVCIECHKTWPK